MLKACGIESRYMLSVEWSEHRFDQDPHICSRGLSKYCGAIMGCVLSLDGRVSDVLAVVSE